jgi:hypothetical protein
MDERMSLKCMGDDELLEDIASFESAIRQYRAELQRRVMPDDEPGALTDLIFQNMDGIEGETKHRSSARFIARAVLTAGYRRMEQSA